MSQIVYDEFAVLSEETYDRTLPMGLLGCRFIFISSEPSTEVEISIYANLLNALKDFRSRGLLHILRLSPDALRVEMVREDEDEDGATEANGIKSLSRLPARHRSSSGPVATANARTSTALGHPGVPPAVFYELMNAHRNGVIVWWKQTAADTLLTHDAELLDIRYEHERMSVFKANMPPHQDPDSLDPIKMMMGPRFESEVLNIPVPTNVRPAFPGHLVELAFLPSRAIDTIKTPFGYKPRIYISYDPAKGAASNSNRSDAILMACIVQHTPLAFAADPSSRSASNSIDAVHYNTALPVHMTMPGSVLSSTNVAINTGPIPGRMAGDGSSISSSSSSSINAGREQIEMFPSIVVRIYFTLHSPQLFLRRFVVFGQLGRGIAALATQHALQLRPIVRRKLLARISIEQLDARDQQLAHEKLHALGALAQARLQALHHGLLVRVKHVHEIRERQAVQHFRVHVFAQPSDATSHSQHLAAHGTRPQHIRDTSKRSVRQHRAHVQHKRHKERALRHHRCRRPRRLLLLLLLLARHVVEPGARRQLRQTRIRIAQRVNIHHRRAIAIHLRCRHTRQRQIRQHWIETRIGGISRKQKTIQHVARAPVIFSPECRRRRDACHLFRRPRVSPTDATNVFSPPPLPPLFFCVCACVRG